MKKTIILTAAGLAVPGLSRAIILNTPLGQQTTIENFAQYISAWYQFIIGSVGVLAVLMIMWAGFRWLTSRGNQEIISDAKDKIWSAIIGLVLVFLIYTISFIINPELTKIELPKLPTAEWSAPNIPNPELTEDIFLDNEIDQEVRDRLEDEGILVKDNFPATQVGGLQEETIQGIIALNEDYQDYFNENCDPIMITGGNENWTHSPTGGHHQGIKLDIRATDDFNNYMTNSLLSTFNPAGETVNNYQIYQRGNMTIINELNHWDIKWE